jgi:hypothetical protein
MAKQSFTFQGVQHVPKVPFGIRFVFVLTSSYVPNSLHCHLIVVVVVKD